MRFKKILCCFLSILLIFSIHGTSFAQGDQKPIINENYTVDDVKNILYPYVSVDENGHFSFDTKRAERDGVERELIDSQLHGFEILNKLADSKQIIINEDLTIIENPLNTKAAYTHRYNCGGGVYYNSSIYYWWGYSRFLCDCATNKMIADYNSVSSIAAGLAVAGVWFGPGLTAGAGLTVAYFSLYASRLNANNYGQGVIASTTWLCIFDVTPQ